MIPIIKHACIENVTPARAKIYHIKCRWSASLVVQLEKQKKHNKIDNGEIEIKKVSTTVKDREHGTLETLKRELMKDLQISTSFQKKFIIMASDMPHGTF